MELTTLLSKIIGPVLLLRALSIVIDRAHFVAMLDGLEDEVRTISFSFFPIALMMSCIALAVVHSDSSSLAGIFIYVIAWGGMIKGSALILFPQRGGGKGSGPTASRVLELRAGRVLHGRGLLHVVWLHPVTIWGSRGIASRPINSRDEKERSRCRHAT